MERKKIPILILPSFLILLLSVANYRSLHDTKLKKLPWGTCLLKKSHPQVLTLSRESVLNSPTIWF
ncbi:hypothetical protein V6Z11_A05G218600 [Gossypium hirsutum]